MSRVIELDIVIAVNIRRYRKRCGLTQGALARAIGVSFQQLQKYEKGTNRISASRLFLMSRKLQLDLESFFMSQE